MSSQQNSNRSEGVVGPLHQEDDINPDDGAEQVYRESLYLAALSKSLDFEGFYSGALDKHNGVDYAFDFYQPEDKMPVKVFHGFDEQEYHLYAGHPGKPIIIFDGSSIPCEIELCECGDGYLLDVDERVAVHLYDDRQVFIYMDGDLWEYATHLNGKWTWRRKIPFLIRQYISECQGGTDTE